MPEYFIIFFVKHEAKTLCEKDLKIITEESQIRTAYDVLLEKLKLAADTKINVNICLLRQTIQKDVYWSKKYLFWWCELPKQKLVFGNCLPETNAYVSTPCYFTIPYIYDSRYGGAFAIDSENNTYLINKGKFFLIKYETNKVLSSKEFIDEHYSGTTVNGICSTLPSRELDTSRTLLSVMIC